VRAVGDIRRSMPSAKIGGTRQSIDMPSAKIWGTRHYFFIFIMARYCAVGPVDEVAECPLYDTRQLLVSPSARYKTLGKINRYFMHY